MKTYEPKKRKYELNFRKDETTLMKFMNTYDKTIYDMKNNFHANNTVMKNSFSTLGSIWTQK